jgi:hypothetical protein
MTGFLVTVSLVCGCVLNTDAVHAEYPDISQVRSMVGSVVTALCDSGVRSEHTSTKLPGGVHAVLTLKDGTPGSHATESGTEARFWGQSNTPFLTPPVRAPSYR